MTIIPLGSMFAVVNRRRRVIFTGTEEECHRYCQEVASMPAFQEV